MKEYLTVLGLIVVFMGGFGYGSLGQYIEHIDECTSYTKKGVVWKGYRTISENNEKRCFFVEQEYPHRVWHGI